MNQRLKITAITLLLGLALALGGCASLKRRNSQSSQEKSPEQSSRGEMKSPELQQTSSDHSAQTQMGPPEPFGPLLTDSTTATAEVLGPVQNLQKSLVIVAGPGLAKSLALAGVLKVLEDEKIKVSGIVGTEMAALVGALYFQLQTSNALDWELQRMKSTCFSITRSLLGIEKLNDGKCLSQSLEQWFGTKSLNAMPEMLVLLKKVKTSTSPLFIAHDGDLSIALRAAMGGGGVFKNSDWQGEEVESTQGARPYPVSEARFRFPNAIVMLVATTEPTSDWQEADIVVDARLNQIKFSDFQKRSEIIFAGKRATSTLLESIKKKLGML